MSTSWRNILLVVGSGQNVGKTTFISDLIHQYKSLQPIAVKVSPHFHRPTVGLRIISESENYQLSEETNQESSKDSSRYLQAGASRSFYLQVEDSFLEEAFLALLPYLDIERPILIESAALNRYIEPGLFVFILNEKDKHKASASANMNIADYILLSDGESFNQAVSRFNFDQSWTIKK